MEFHKNWASPGFEPGTSRTRSANHTPRPTGHTGMRKIHSYYSSIYLSKNFYWYAHCKVTNFRPVPMLVLLTSSRSLFSSLNAWLADLLIVSSYYSFSEFRTASFYRLISDSSYIFFVLLF